MRRVAFVLLTGLLLSAIPPALSTSFAQATATPMATATATATTTPTVTSTGGPATATTTPTSTLAPALWVPIAVKGVGGDNSGIQVQNISGGSASVSLDYYDQAGTLVTSEPTQSVAAGSSVTFYQPAQGLLPLGFDGSAVVRSSTSQVAAIVNRAVIGGTASDGSITIPPGASTATQASVPLVYGGLNGYVTTISVDNSSTTTGTYTVALQANVGSTGTASLSLTIPPTAVRRVRVGTDVAVPGGFMGTALITGTTSLVAAGESRNTSTTVLLSAGGVATGTTTVNSPLLFKNYDANMWVSGAQVVNTSSGTVTVNGTIRSRDDNTSYGLASITLGPNQGYFYDMLAVSGLPDNFVGS